MNKEQYIKQVLKELPVSRKMKKRIKVDLDQRIDDAMERDPYFDLVTEMGTPREFAVEFMDNVEESHEWATLMMNRKPYEYKSKKTLFGVPLVHINLGNGYGSTVAKGIIALGDIAIGVVSVGGVSVGVIAVGGVGIGLAALGGVAIGGFVAGGVAVGAYAFGAVAIGVLKTFGALSLL